MDAVASIRPAALAKPTVRVRLQIRGVVQGVGFRPFLCRLAQDLGVSGWAANASNGVIADIEGAPGALDEFMRRLEGAKLPGARIRAIRRRPLPPAGHTGFEVRPSLQSAPGHALPGPDRALCDACRRELFDPGDRRYRYPFIGCTGCGPRYTIVERLPFDRAATTMAGFAMCDRCRAECEDPADRRFHAQVNCCATCGPQVALWRPDGSTLVAGDRAVAETVASLRRGDIIAVKGVGGFHLLVDAANAGAVARLRERKHRPRKPFALMFPDIAAIERCCHVPAVARETLESPEAPIVLLRRRGDTGDPFTGVAPGLSHLGVMLPYSPLHHLLAADFGGALVATSGNRGGEPLCTDEHEALDRLGGIADLFLVHDRCIVRPLDDSVVRIACGRPLLLRRARGYVPRPVARPGRNDDVLAAGGHLKSTVALGAGDAVALSQHLGDLDTRQARAGHRRAADDLVSLLRAEPAVTVIDLHPDYASRGIGEASRGPVIEVQHHYAHALACMVDNHIEPPALAVVWDGAGLGTDGRIWGGEFLSVGHEGFVRCASLREFGLPGGEQAMREPRRAALGLLWECFGPDSVERRTLQSIKAFDDIEMRALVVMLRRGLNTPRTSSAGRLFDAVSSLLGLCQRANYEGEAAILLESAAATDTTAAPYPFALSDAGAGRRLVIDWQPLIEALLDDLEAGEEPASIASRFHATLAAAISDVAERAAIEQVVLSGGCFQNALLLKHTVRRLRAAGLQPFWHRDLPPNDGGLAVGQVLAADRVLAARARIPATAET